MHNPWVRVGGQAARLRSASRAWLAPWHAMPSGGGVVRANAGDSECNATIAMDPEAERAVAVTAGSDAESSVTRNGRLLRPGGS